MTEDYFTHTEADAGRYAARFADHDDDRPSLSDLADDDPWGAFDPKWAELMEALQAMNRAESALSDATYGPSNGSRKDTTHLQNQWEAAHERARNLMAEWRFPR